MAPALWTFVHIPGVGPTNNAAKRAVLPGVLWRKGCFGTDSGGGCRQQRRKFMDFVTTQFLDVDLLGKPVPSLLSQIDEPVLQGA